MRINSQFITLFEDDSILAIDKPSGLPSNSLTNSTMSCESLLQKTRGSETLFLIHRLDTGTSGVLLFAKNEPAFHEMREQFKLKKVEKRYLAWTAKNSEHEGVLKTLRFPHILDLAIAHHAKSKKKMIVVPERVHRHMRGKPIPAKSLIHSVSDDLFFGVPAFRFEVEIETGVMHQIRVHLSSMQLPLLGDPTYNKEPENEKTRLGLHAHRIRFSLGGFRYQIESLWPNETPIWCV